MINIIQAIQNEWFLLDCFSRTVVVFLVRLMPVPGQFMCSRNHLAKLFLGTQPDYRVPQLFSILDIYRH